MSMLLSLACVAGSFVGGLVVSAPFLLWCRKELALAKSRISALESAVQPAVAQVESVVNKVNTVVKSV